MTNRYGIFDFNLHHQNPNECLHFDQTKEALLHYLDEGSAEEISEEEHLADHVVLDFVNWDVWGVLMVDDVGSWKITKNDEENTSI